MSKTIRYLYGAAIQGIQGFIFQTNKLAEIAEGSELIEQICTDFFKDQFTNGKFYVDNLILGAAGNIKYIFEDKAECEKIVREFPKAVMEMAPGITISQAVIEYDEGNLNNSLLQLEEKLRIQRNKVPVPFEVGFMGMRRNRRTGGVAFNKSPVAKDNETVDEATFKKLKARGSNKLFEKISGITDFKTEELLFNTDDLKGSWLAVVHADGNGLGTIIQNLNEKFKGKPDEEVRQGFKQFSQALDNATQQAAQEAFKSAGITKDEGKFPIRPIILGGDDLTVIIRADLAFGFTKAFLEEFEKQTEKKFDFLKEYTGDQFKKGITACAGIAYVKKSYPFHYAIDLAEKLCSDAKNFVKGKGKYSGKAPKMDGLIPKSALAFFKVQDSFIEDSLSDMKKRVLTGNNIDFRYGPYLIENDNHFANVGELTQKLNIIKDHGEKADKGESNGISKLRQWVTEVFKDTTTADFFLKRMEVVNYEFFKKFDPRETKNDKSIVFDVIQLNSF